MILSRTLFIVPLFLFTVSAFAQSDYLRQDSDGYQKYGAEPTSSGKVAKQSPIDWLKSRLANSNISTDSNGNVKYNDQFVANIGDLYSAAVQIKDGAKEMDAVRGKIRGKDSEANGYVVGVLSGVAKQPEFKEMTKSHFWPFN